MRLIAPTPFAADRETTGGQPQRSFVSRNPGNKPAETLAAAACRLRPHHGWSVRAHRSRSCAPAPRPLGPAVRRLRPRRRHRAAGPGGRRGIGTAIRDRWKLRSIPWHAAHNALARRDRHSEFRQRGVDVNSGVADQQAAVCVKLEGEIVVMQVTGWGIGSIGLSAS